MATLATIISSIVMGTIVGCWLTLVAATAAISRSQEHMQKKVRYWQAQAGAAGREGYPDRESVRL